MNKARKILYGLFENDQAYNSARGEWNNTQVVFSSNWDENSEPDCYVLLRYDVSNIGADYGDGKPTRRISDCDIILICSGCENKKKAKLESEVERLLQDFSYSKINLGFNDSLKVEQITYSIRIKYEV